MIAGKMLPPYAELHCHSYFSFLDGASPPEALVARAAAIGLPALALTDHDGLYGALRFQTAAREVGVRPIFGTEMTLAGGAHLTLLAINAYGYANLSRLISYARQRQPKGKAALDPALLAAHSAGLVCLSGCQNGPLAPLLLRHDYEAARRKLGELAGWFAPGCFYVEVQRQLRRQGNRLYLALSELADELGLPVAATNNVHYALDESARLQDILVCIRNNTSLAEGGALLRPNSEAYLRSAAEMAELFADRPQALENAAAIAERCQVTLDFSSVNVPEFPLPDGETADSYLCRLCEEALPRRYEPNPPTPFPKREGGDEGRHGGLPLRNRSVGADASVRPRPSPRRGGAGGEVRLRAQMEHELEIIRQTGLAEYFLTVYDIVAWAKGQGIRCQGRGSAANSIVAYLLGITAVDPLEQHLLFERFLSVERHTADKTMPDIDLDFERDRREEVIQYVYGRYGWEHTAMVCTLVSFRARSAIRDVGKALGFAPEALDRVAKHTDFRGAGHVSAETLRDILDEDADTARWQSLFDLCRQIDGFPRHLGIHVGGMIVTRCPLIEVVPVEPATMPGRVVVQWDKDSVEDAGLIKIDLLSLAMLSAISESLGLLAKEPGVRSQEKGEGSQDPGVRRREVRAEATRLKNRGAGSRQAESARLAPGSWLPDSGFRDRRIYDMICRGDTIGVFQVESRAQAQMLPRLQPRCFNDLVIEVALVRPGPLQGGMVNPYLKRRRREEPVVYEHPGMASALADTLGIIVFQEQVLLVARDVAGFSAGEGEMLRRAMSRKRSREEMERLRERFVQGAMANDATETTAHHIFDQLAAFSGYGFNRAHAASFALLTYVSAWLKRYHPRQFFTALLNNQPMGFYSPAVVAEDAKRHDIKLLPVDISVSGERCSIESGAIRLGLNYVHGFGPEVCVAVVAERAERGPFLGLDDLCRRTRLGRDVLEGLILCGGCDGWGVPRRQLLWRLGRAMELAAQAGAQQAAPLLDDLPAVSLPDLEPGEALAMELAFTGVSSSDSPAALFRRALVEAGAMSSLHLMDAPRGAWVRVGGQVIVRQRPGTAKGFVFITLQDEWGTINLVLRPDLYPRYRQEVRAPGLIADGIVDRDGRVINVRVERLWPLEPEIYARHDDEGDEEAEAAASSLRTGSAAQARLSASHDWR